MRPGSIVTDDPIPSTPGPDTRTTGETSDDFASPKRGGWGVAGLWALLAVPLVVAVGVLARPRWFPVLELAMTELAVRDVASGDPPLVGLAGRIGTPAEPGNHPGPLSFWALWPFYQLFGAGSLALHAAAVSLHLLATAAILWIAHRRGGLVLAAGFAAMLALVMRTYGTSTLTEAWNPYLPVLWFLVLLVAVWSVLCEDDAMLPLAVFAASFCAQTHIPYAGLTGGLAALTIAAISWRVIIARRNGREPGGRPGRWVAISAALAVVLWLPPIVQELTTSPGNLTIIWRTFSDPAEAPLGVGGAVEPLLVHLNPWNLLATRSLETTGSILPGLVLLAAWVAAVATAWRLRHRSMLRLHGVVGAALVLGLVSASRIYGYVWFYLLHWAWGLAGLVLLAIGWTAAAAADRRHAALSPHRPSPERSSRMPDARWATAGLATVAVAFAVLFTVDAAHSEVPTPRLSAALADVSPAVVDSLNADRPYLVTWNDPVHLSSQGYGLLLELERQGLDVGALEPFRASVGDHRVMAPSEADGNVHLSVGPDIEARRALPGFEQVASSDPRTAGERREYEQLQDGAQRDLRAAELDDTATLVETNLFLAALQPGLPADVEQRIIRMIDLGEPIAVFVGPPPEDGT
ncbi:hypothetical protein BH24ACT3_BH24ACT3_15780 [soil metagenome]